MQHKKFVVGIYLILFICALILAILFLNPHTGSTVAETTSDIKTRVSSNTIETTMPQKTHDSNTDMATFALLAQQYFDAITIGPRALAANINGWETDMTKLTGEYAFMTSDGQYVSRSAFNSMLADSLIQNEIEGHLEFNATKIETTPDGVTLSGTLSGKLYGNTDPVLALLGLQQWHDNSEISISFIQNPSELNTYHLATITTSDIAGMR